MPLTQPLSPFPDLEQEVYCPVLSRWCTQRLMALASSVRDRLR